MNENQMHQEEIFRSLSLTDLEKMFKNLEDSNDRKIDLLSSYKQNSEINQDQSFTKGIGEVSL